MRSFPQRRKNAKKIFAWRLCVFAGFIPWLFSVAVAQESLEQRQSRGRQIYIQGTSRSGKEILAYVGDASLEVPASTIPCAGCHGLDGRGKPEGGVNPSNVTWEFLTKPYGLKHESGRQHPPYTERGLELAITRGVDPGGNKLLQAMPRYVMSREDLADLIAYLQLVGKEQSPGVSSDKIVIGTLVPASGPLAAMGQAVIAATKAVFEETNSQGGIFGRKLELQVIEAAENASATRAKVEPLLKNQQMFAMSGAIVAGSEKELLPLLGQTEVPLIGPISIYPQIGFPLNRYVFYLLSGLEGQARSLLNFVEQKPEFKNSNVALVSPRTGINADVIESVKDYKKKHAATAPAVFEYDSGRFNVVDAIKQAKQPGVEVVIFLGSGEDALSFMREAEKLNWFPAMLVPGGAAGAVVFNGPIGFDRKVFFSFATSPADHTAEGSKEFRALREKYKLPESHVAAQISTYAAAKILVEALRRVGKDVSRERLIQALEGFHEFSTGMTPAVTYGPNRRIGANGAYIVTIDLKAKQFLPVSGWIESN